MAGQTIHRADSEAAQAEIRELIIYYEKHGWDWFSAVAFTCARYWTTGND